MTFAQPDPPDDDAERLAIVLAPKMIARVSGLFAITMLPNDRELLENIARTEPKRLTAAQRHQVQRLLWKYRRELPHELRPKLNPDDPIVRELENAGV